MEERTRKGDARGLHVIPAAIASKSPFWVEWDEHTVNISADFVVKCPFVANVVTKQVNVLPKPTFSASIPPPYSYG